MYLKKILKVLTDSGLDYCIQNGYENMPYSCSTDVDIFYRGATEKDIDKIVKKAAADANLLVLQKIAMGYYHYVYWLTPELPDSNFQLELDFQSELSNKVMPHYFIPNKLLDRKKEFRGFYIPSPSDEIVYTLLRRTVKHNFSGKHLETLRKAYYTNPEEIEGLLKEELPTDIVEGLQDIIKDNSVETFERYYPKFYDYVCKQSHKNNTVIKRMSQMWYNATKMLPLRFMKPAGMAIALLAPDGGGKSTILEMLKTYGITSFAGVERKYIRPEMFKNIGQYKPNAKPEMTDNPNPHGRKPDNAMKSLIRFMIYLIDFTLGYFIKVVPLKWQRKLVVFDRYYYDYYVDMYRYHYSLPLWLPRLFGFLIPRPAITFILHASPKVIYNRKKELTIEETQRQCEVFKKLAQTLPNARLIDVDRPVNAIVKEIVAAIIEKRVKLTQNKL